MADNGSIGRGTWPMPKFRFQVDFGSNIKKADFQEASGLELDHSSIQYPSGSSPSFSETKMPSLTKNTTVILKKGVFASDDNFMKWYSAVNMNTMKRATIKIALIDEDDNTTMQWELKNAWPTKIKAIDLIPTDGEIYVDSIEIAHEG